MCFLDLPAGYGEVVLYDTKSRRFRLLTGPVSFLISALLAAGIVYAKCGFSFADFPLTLQPRYLFHIITLVLLVLVYTSLHELTHGAVYALITKERPIFGFYGSCAYCGVPGVYVKRWVALLSCGAPFLLFTPVFGVLLAVLPLSPFWFVLLIGFANHFGGCFPDLWGCIAMLRYDRSLLMCDSGREQHFYVRADLMG